MAESDSTTENWKSVVGYEGHYEVSDLGRVRSVTRVITDKNGKAITKRGSQIRTQDLHGYKMFGLHLAKRAKTTYVHRVVWEAFVGPIPVGVSIDHINFDRGDNRLSNLQAITQLENIHRTKRAGRAAIGDRHGRHKLSEAEVREVRRLLARGAMTQDAIGRLFGVGQFAIWRIAAGLGWKHLA